MVATGTERGTGGVFFGGVDVETRTGTEGTGVAFLVGVEGAGAEGVGVSFFEGVVADGAGITVFEGVERTGELFEGVEGVAAEGTGFFEGVEGAGYSDTVGDAGFLRLEGADFEGVEVPKGTGEETIGIWIFDTRILGGVMTGVGTLGDAKGFFGVIITFMVTGDFTGNFVGDFTGVDITPEVTFSPSLGDTFIQKFSSRIASIRSRSFSSIASSSIFADCCSFHSLYYNQY